ncbi:hypothetical protein ACHAWO_002807 [Cyclotella atomus]|uniref:C2H2-type domain-containing protein n=1 Tax=Cyclotella atomus TaxID=382360 RepID=A0ABD3PNA1_9STRA
MPSTAAPAEYAPEGNFEKRRKLEDDEAEASREGGPSAPPTPQGGGPPDGRYYDPYAVPMGRYPYDDGHYREPPSMPYARGHPGAPSPKHHPHGHYAYPPPPQKDYYQHPHPYHEYPPPPPGWGHPPPPHYHHKAPGQPFSPRYGQPYEYHDSRQQQYAVTEPSNAPGRPKPPSNADSSYQSPTSVVNALDTRSPEGSRNLNNFEERVGGGPSSNMYPPHGPPQPYYAPPIHSPSHHHNAPSRQWWSCDYCSYKFSTWEECSAHESMCPHHHNANNRGARSSKKRPVDSSILDDYLHPHEEYANNTDRPIFTLALPPDGQSLSDRQCYVRTHFVELFIATESDVQARHSRGAQKLHLNQVGLRCAYCAKLKPRDRAERAVCYPSSISRIYQTVADMQRFHFEACTAIPPKVLRVYKSLKTTRPRGVGSPQSYWEKSARELGLMDSECGIVLRDGGILVQKTPVENVGAEQHHAGVNIPSLAPGDVPVEQQWENVGSPQEDQGHQEEEGQEKPSEADASILLMLKNPASPKSMDEAAEQGEAKHAEV